MSTFSLKMEIVDNANFTGEQSKLFCAAEGSKALSFHKKLKGYTPTPLYSLDALAEYIGIGKILIKDESKRFGLNAFKMLGGAYAVARMLCDEYGMNINNFDFDKVKKEIDGRMTFTSTTDGNHGRGVAWAAQQLGQKCVIYMPKGAAAERVNNIKALGAECIVTDMNYDDTVRLTDKTAKANGWVVVQDTSWEGYEKIPTWIMQGYSTMGLEAVNQMKEAGIQKPTHVFLQAGVGAMAGGVLGLLADTFGAKELHSVIVEPENANCIFRSGKAGKSVNVTGDLDTIMAGLACGEPCPLGWEVLRNCATQFVSCEDKVAAFGMRVLGNPLANDPRVISGESGAATLGFLISVAQSPNKEALFEKLRLTKDSVVLLFSTEGDTDQVNYREVVWEGKYPVSSH